MRYAIGVDVGGTHVKAASVSENGVVLDRVDGHTRDADPGAFVAVAQPIKEQQSKSPVTPPNADRPRFIRGAFVIHVSSVVPVA